MSDIDKRLEELHDGLKRLNGRNDVRIDWMIEIVEELSPQLRAEHEEKERLKQEKARIMKLYTEQLENDGNQLDKYELALREIISMPYGLREEMVKIAKHALGGDRE